LDASSKRAAPTRQRAPHDAPDTPVPAALEATSHTFSMKILEDEDAVSLAQYTLKMCATPEMGCSKYGGLHLCIYIQIERVSAANERASTLETRSVWACILRIYCARLTASSFSTIFIENASEAASSAGLDT